MSVLKKIEASGKIEKEDIPRMKNWGGVYGLKGKMSQSYNFGPQACKAFGGGKHLNKKEGTYKDVEKVLPYIVDYFEKKWERGQIVMMAELHKVFDIKPQKFLGYICMHHLSPFKNRIFRYFKLIESTELLEGKYRGNFIHGQENVWKYDDFSGEIFFFRQPYFIKDCNIQNGDFPEDNQQCCSYHILKAERKYGGSKYRDIKVNNAICQTLKGCKCLNQAYNE